MDVQLKELIEKIKTEGVQTAEEQAAQIIAEAEKRAAEIVKKAQDDSAKIVETAEKEAEKLQSTGKAALQQAGRNMLLGLKEKIEKVFNAVVIEEAGTSLSGKNLEEAIVKAVGSMKTDELQDMSVLVHQDDLKAIEQGLRSSLAKEIKSGLEIKPVESALSGFRVSEKDGSAYFNYTAEGVAEILCEYLNPRLAEILRDAVKEE